VDDLIAGERRFFRSVDHGVIGARIDALYAFAARSLGEPRVEGLVRDGMPAYLCPSNASRPWLEAAGAFFPGATWATGGRRTSRGLPGSSEPAPGYGDGHKPKSGL
jgi:hypothetical protein